MSTLTNTFQKLKTSRWIEYFNIPLHRNGFALVISLVSTSVLGLAYWSVAARNFTAEEVGINTAIISGMMFLGNISQFGLVNFLNRFLPKAGRSTIRFIAFTYAFSFFISLLSSGLFILGVSLWSPTLGFLRSDPWLFAWFVLSTALWCIFALQDGVLVGLRHATWVPVENIIFALVKLGLLFVFSGFFFQFGIFASWTFPLIFLIVVINALIFGSIIPKHLYETEQQAEHFKLSQIVRFVLGDYFSTLVWMATVNLMPIIVLELSGPEANAYFYLPWMITYSLYMISRNMGMSFTVEASKDQSYIREFSYRSIIQTSILLIPVILVILIASPFILTLFGADYAAEGSSLLRLLALSALPYIITSLHISIARVQQRIMNIVITMSVLCGMVLLITFMFLGRFGLVGVGWAWFISQSVVAVVIALTSLRKILFFEPGKKLIQIFSQSVQRLRFIFLKRRIYALVNSATQEIASSFPRQKEPIDLKNLAVHRIFNTLSDMAVASLGRNTSSPEYILYLPQSSFAEKRMNSQLRILAILEADERLGEWRMLLPKLSGKGRVGGKPFWISAYIPGHQAHEFMKDPSMKDDVLRTAGEAIMDLHLKTIVIVDVNAPILKNWIHNPIRIIKNSWLPYYKRRAKITLDRLQEVLEQNLRNRKLALSWIQGDYWPQNIIISPDGKKVNGIVDWDQAQPCDLPYLDLTNLFLSTRRLNEPREIGELIVDIISRNTWRPVEQQLWEDEGRALGGLVPGIQETMLLFWLRHISSNLTKSKRYASNPIWALKNFTTVLDVLNSWEDLRFLQTDLFPKIWGKPK